MSTLTSLLSPIQSSLQDVVGERLANALTPAAAILSATLAARVGLFYTGMACELLCSREQNKAIKNLLGINGQSPGQLPMVAFKNMSTDLKIASVIAVHELGIEFQDEISQSIQDFIVKGNNVIDQVSKEAETVLTLAQQQASNFAQQVETEATKIVTEGSKFIDTKIEELKAFDKYLDSEITKIVKDGTEFVTKNVDKAQTVVQGKLSAINTQYVKPITMKGLQIGTSILRETSKQLSNAAAYLDPVQL